jgi:ABC-type Na+ efflux pump permease subunit
MRQISKKGNIGAIQAFIMGIVSVAVILALGLYVLQEISDNTKDGGNATDASDAVDGIITELAGVPTWIGLLIVVVFAAAVLSYFYFRG